MKKIFFLGLILTLLAVGASAQIRSGDGSRRYRIEKNERRSQLNRYEKRRLFYDQQRINRTRRRAERDGRINPFERRRLRNMKMHERRELFRFRHNRFRRVI